MILGLKSLVLLREIWKCIVFLFNYKGKLGVYKFDDNWVKKKICVVGFRRC